MRSILAQYSINMEIYNINLFIIQRVALNQILVLLMAINIKAHK